MSKKALYGVIAIVVIIIVIGAALAVYYYKPAPSKPSKPTSQVTGTFTYDTIGDPQTLDPAEAYDDASDLVIENVYETLVTYQGSDTTKMYPDLATNWTVDSSGKVWTFHLRKGVKFSNGDPCDAQAVKFSFDRVLIMGSPQTGVSWILSQFMYSYNKTTGKWNSPDGESSVRVIDNNTVQFKLRKAYGGFLPAIAYSVASIVDPKVVNAHGGVQPGKDNDWMYEHMVGTGPYKLVEWKHNAYIKLEYNPDYWGGWKGKHFQYIMIKNIPEVATREQELLRGDADIVYIPINHLTDVEGKSGITVNKGGLTYDVDMIEMNCRPTYENKTNPLHSKLVRQAISYAIDYNTLLKDIYKGYAIQMQGPIPKGMPGHDDNLFMYHHDPQKAKELLKEAGYEKGFTITFIYNQGNDVRAHIAQIVKEDLADVGIAVQIQELAWPVVLDKMERGDYSMIIVGWVPDYNDPDDYAFPFLASSQIGGDYYRTGWHNATVDKLLMEAKYEVDQNKRAELYKEIQQIAMQDPAFIYLAQWKHVVVYRSWLKGYYFNPVRMLNLYHLYKETS